MNVVSGAGASAVELLEVRSRRDLDAFIRFPLSLYARDPLYAPQLTGDLRAHFSDKNPFLRSSEVKFFLALKEGRVAGRIATIINPDHIRLHNERAGFFGFYESDNDTAVSTALYQRAAAELRAKGMELMRGPMNFSTNEECGFQIEGFSSPPLLMTPYNPPYYNDLAAGFGMGKAKDLHAYRYEFRTELLDKVQRVAALAEKRGVTVRPVEKKNFMADMEVFRRIYNAAWEKNWGYVPFSEDELRYAAKRLKPLAVPELTLIAEKDGEPVGFLGLIPDFNVVLRRMGGRLTPLSLLKALYYSRKITSLRLLLYGVTPAYRRQGVDALLFKKGFEAILKGGYRTLEFSWILEDNLPVIRITELFGATLYKKYRIYEKDIRHIGE